MSDILGKIIEYKKLELQGTRRKVSLRDVKMKAADAAPVREFLGGFVKDGLNVIAEVKKASPSAGVIRADFDAVRVALAYAQTGARALSVLTDTKFFQGSLADLSQVRAAVGLPVLRKDFTLAEYHIHESRGAGADAILLIVAVLDDPQLKDYLAITEGLGMQALVEVHNDGELKRALKIAPRLVGINNRNLKTLVTDVQVSRDMLTAMQSHPGRGQMKVISESGLKDHDTLVALAKQGADGFLIGEALLKTGDPGRKLMEFLGAITSETLAPSDERATRSPKK